MFIKRKKFLAMSKALRENNTHLALAQSLVEERTALLISYAAAARSLLRKDLSFGETIRKLDSKLRNNGIL